MTLCLSLFSGDCKKIISSHRKNATFFVSVWEISARQKKKFSFAILTLIVQFCVVNSTQAKKPLVRRVWWHCSTHSCYAIHRWSEILWGILVRYFQSVDLFYPHIFFPFNLSYPIRIHFPLLSLSFSLTLMIKLAFVFSLCCIKKCGPVFEQMFSYNV